MTPRLCINIANREGLGAPNVDGCKQEQPYHINKVPIPSSSFKTNVLFLCEVTALQADQTHQQEDRTDNNVEAMKASRHEEVRAIDVTRKAKRRVGVFIHLESSEDQAKHHRKDQTVFHVFTVVFVHKSVVRPSCRRT